MAQIVCRIENFYHAQLFQSQALTLTDGSAASALMLKSSTMLLFTVNLFIHHESAICYYIVPLTHALNNHLSIHV